MKMYLQHYFNPDFDYLQLQPIVSAKGQADLYNLGYVQNVVKGQVIAELIPLDAIKNPNSKFVLEQAEFPQGPNTYIDPAYPNYLLSNVNGYVFYYNGTIAVKKILNVRSNVDFHTGNIVFVSDLIVHQDVKAGFQVQANNILINGMVEGGEVRSRKDMKILGGARGGASNRCLLDSGGGLQLNFAEQVELRVKKRMVIERFCMQCKIYAGESVIVSGVMAGGTAQVSKHIFIKDKLGNTSGISTQLFLGYNPFLLQKLENCDVSLELLNKKITNYTTIAGQSSSNINEINAQLEGVIQQHKQLMNYRNKLWQLLQLDESNASSCRLVVLGTVYPGIELSIGTVSFSVKEELNNVCFRLHEDEIICEAVPETILSFFKK